MDFLLNFSKKDFIINNTHRSLPDDNLAYIQKNPLNLFNTSGGQPSIDGWSPSLIPPGVSDHYHQNPIPLIPDQNSDSINRNLVNASFPVYNPLVAEVQSKYPFMGIDPYSRIDSYEESINNITNKGIITSGYEPTLDNIMVESLPVPEGIQSTTREIINQHQGEVMIQTDQEKNKKVVRRSKPLKKANIIKGKWTSNENINLKELVKLYGTKQWGLIAKKLGGRVGKQCRERWHNYLRPDIKKDAWTEEEDQILIEAHRVVGNKWTEIAKQLPGRGENAIKNRWNTTKRRMQLMKAKQNHENANPPHNNILESYISNVTINNDPPKDTETTENTKDDDDDGKNVFDGDMNMSLDVTTVTAEPLVDASTTSVHVPEPATSTWDDFFTELCESMDPQMLMQGWE